MRRILAKAALLSLAALCAAGPGALPAQSYPAKPVQFIVSLPAGTGTDILARALARGFEEKLRQPFVVVNRTGNGIMVATTALATAPADGYTVGVLPSTVLTVQPHREKQLPWTRNTFVPLCQAFENVLFVGVSASGKFPNLAALLSYAKANPGKLRFGTSGVASAPHLAGAELFRQAGAEVTDVPYRGETAYLPDILNGTIEMGAVSANLITTQKGLKPLAVFFKERLKAYPDVPTTAELGFPVSTLAYFGLWIRSDAPAAAITALDTTCREVATSAAFVDAAEKQFALATHLDRKAFTARLDSDQAITGRLLAGLKLKD